MLRELLPLISIAIDRVRRLHRERLYRAVLEDFNRNMPVGLLLLDWELNIIYANTEAIRLIATWNYGLEKSKQYNPREVFKLPEELLESCRSLRSKIIEEGDPGVRSLSKTPISVNMCPDWLRCAVQPIRLNSVNIAHPGFFLSIEHDEEQRAEPSPEINHEKLLLLNQLTPSERELALLVGEGLSNREIADKLNKSVLTVKKQLNSTFGKLNISNRARLIALLH
jgi:DNA-binding CsgD family transcriptional regulator